MALFVVLRVCLCLLLLRLKYCTRLTQLALIEVFERRTGESASKPS
jgi:hypothetical protein